MTSQKRYRHHENNSAARFSRDIPPRFKRQKSSSSPKPTDDIDNQENQCVNQPSVVPDPALPCSSATMTPVPSNKEEVNTSNGVGQNQNRSGSSNVLSEMDNVVYPAQNWNVVSDEQFPSVSGYTSPPLYTWQSQHTAHTNPALQQQRLYSYQPYMQSRDAISPSLKMAQVKSEESMLGYVSNGQRNMSPPSCMSSPGMPMGHVDNRATSTPDYSDPDIRTIEMLRELERVADEKEKEDENDPTVDRKNLVSHHLRMLMCAVDKYTEGVDDSALSPQSQASTDRDKSFPAKRQNVKGQYSGVAVNPLSSQNFPPLSDETQWQTVASSSRRQTPKSMNSPTTQGYTPQNKTPPPVSSPARTPPPPGHRAVVGSAAAPRVSPQHSLTPPAAPRVSPQHSLTPPPYVAHQTTGYPMRAITKYNPDQIPAQPILPPHRSPLVNNTMTMPCNLSPAPSPPTQTKHVWGPASMDSPMDSKSWDIWSAPSFVTDVYSNRPNVQTGNASNNMSWYPFVPYAPVDVKDHMPLYKR